MQESCLARSAEPRLKGNGRCWHRRGRRIQKPGLAARQALFRNEGKTHVRFADPADKHLPDVELVGTRHHENGTPVVFFCVNPEQVESEPRIGNALINRPTASW